MVAEKAKPAISIILPLYNTARFLPSGIKSIRDQTFTDWELVCIDDGSTDNTAELLHELTKDIPQPVTYHRQENGGGFAARNTGLDLARGAYIAFFDCDDIWYPQHLQNCVAALEAAPDVDWVFGLNKIIDLTTNRYVTENSFYEADGKPRSVVQLKTRPAGKLKVFENESALLCQIEHGIWAGQQFSLIRRGVFEGYRFRASYRNEGADQVSVIRALQQGFAIGYLDEIHGEYCIHQNNASAGAKGASDEKYLRLYRALIRGFEEVREEERLTGTAARAIERKIARVQFWKIGYSMLLLRGKRDEAIAEFKSALKRWPWEIGMWKTFLATLIRSAITR